MVAQNVLPVVHGGAGTSAPTPCMPSWCDFESPARGPLPLQSCLANCPRGIAVAILHPGLVRTRMIQFNPSGISPEQSVRGLLARIDALTPANSGTFWHANGELLPW